MAHFRGEIRGSLGAPATARQSTRQAGLIVRAQSWGGDVVVQMTHDPATGVDNVIVALHPHADAKTITSTSDYVVLYRGPVDGWKHKHLIGTVGRMLLDDEARELKTLTSA